jgi:hypothetical protein
MAAKCRAAVPLLTAIAYLQPIYSAKAFSKVEMTGPCVKKSDVK